MLKWNSISFFNFFTDWKHAFSKIRDNSETEYSWGKKQKTLFAQQDNIKMPKAWKRYCQVRLVVVKRTQIKKNKENKRNIKSMKTILPGSVGGEENATRFQCFSSSCDPRWGQGAASCFDNDDNGDVEFLIASMLAMINIALQTLQNLMRKIREKSFWHWLKMFQHVRRRRSRAVREEKRRADTLHPRLVGVMIIMMVCPILILGIMWSWHWCSLMMMVITRKDWILRDR